MLLLIVKWPDRANISLLKPLGTSPTACFLSFLSQGLLVVLHPKVASPSLSPGLFSPTQGKNRKSCSGRTKNVNFSVDSIKEKRVCDKASVIYHGEGSAQY